MMRRSRRVTVVGILGAAATALLHSMLIVAALWGGGMPRFPDQPDAIGAGANQGTPEGDSGERRMVVRLLEEIISQDPPPTPDAYLAEQVSNALKLEITGPDALPLPPLVIQEDGIPADSTDAELIARTKMVGIYESQIRARIERAWTLPDGLPKEQDFSCRALIRQHRDGRISEVELPYEKCDSSPAARQSVVNAIFTASPLPAPPHPGVFVDSFSIVLHSEVVRGR
jgi:hypothetical protein